MNPNLISLYYKAPILQEIYGDVSTMCASRIVLFKINMSSKYIITLMLIFLRSEIKIFNNFVNTCQSSLKQSYMNL